jgi:hypothetical protein
VIASKLVISFGAKARALGWIAALLLTLAAPLGAGRAPGSIAAALVPGETLRYLLEYRSSIQSQSAGPIYTPEAAHRLDISLGARMRLDVLGVKTDPKQGRLTRLRVTYETCDASVHSDAYDPGAETLQKQYRDLQGRSFEFTIDEQGRVRDIAGLRKLEPDEGARNAIRQWLSSITLPLGLWKPGLKPGKKWSREVPLAGAPLTGLAWRTQSSYRDNEACPAPLGAPAPSRRQTCAVISTRLETVRGNSHGDPTPLSYRREGLRTSGRWTAHGESLSFVSLSSGLVASSIATESDTMDVTIAATLSGSRLHYAGQVQSSSQIALIAVTLPGGGRR